MFVVIIQDEIYNDNIYLSLYKRIHIINKRFLKQNDA